MGAEHSVPRHALSTTLQPFRPGRHSTTTITPPLLPLQSKSTLTFAATATKISRGGGGGGLGHHHNNKLLSTLVWNQEWQQVLIRLQLFPHEGRRQQAKIKIELFGGKLFAITLLHLVCCLQPPAAVVQALLVLSLLDEDDDNDNDQNHHHNNKNAAALPVCLVQRKRRRRQNDGGGGKSGRRTKLWSRFRRGLRPYEKQPRQAATAAEDPSLSYSNNDDSSNNMMRSSSLLDDSDKGTQDDSQEMSQGEDEESLAAQGLVLQLTNSGGLLPIPLQSSSSSSSSSQSWNKASEQPILAAPDAWNPNDLLDALEQDNNNLPLLPLHLAILYRADATVLQLLLEHFPAAARVKLLGRAPIHMICANQQLAPLVIKPRWLEETPCSAADKLAVLLQMAPESKLVTCQKGLLAVDYVNVCLTGDESELCLRLLEKDEDYPKSSDATVGNMPFACSAEMMELVADEEEGFFYDDDDDDDDDYMINARPWKRRVYENDIGCSFKNQPARRTWNEKHLRKMQPNELLDNPTTNGLGHNAANIGGVVPYNVVCEDSSPKGVVRVLLYGQDAVALDTDCPLHGIVSHERPSLDLMQLLLLACPQATKSVDEWGRVPLHVALASQAPYDIISALVEADPASAMCVDVQGKAPLDYAVAIYGPDSELAELLNMVLKYVDDDAEGSNDERMAI